MELKANTKLGALILIFITVMVGIILAQHLADEIWKTNNFHSVTNETINISASLIELNTRDDGMADFNPLIAINLGEDNLITVSEVRHANGTIITQGTDWRIASDLKGTINMLNSSTNLAWNATESSGNATLWDYTHSDEYVGDRVSRILLGLIVLFFTIGLVVWLIGYVWNTYIKDMTGV